MSCLIAIIGRPNVGKSTLFNRLTESRQAIVDEASGVTRDRHYGKVEWCGKHFSIIDTGGYITGSDDVYEAEIRRQVVISLEESDAVMFLVDVTTGITDLDEDVAQILRKSAKKVFLVVNKVDNNERINESHVFHRLGLGEPFCISSINGSGTGELLDAINQELEVASEPEDLGLPKFAIVGQPNVGKSSFLNVLLGEERTIVNPNAGTTRDTIHTHYKGFGKDFLLIDTAGLRKKSKVHEDLEFYSVMRTIKAIEDADVCFLMIDAQTGIESQDLNILHLIEKNRKGLVIIVNKWDLVEKDDKSTKAYTENILERIAPFTDVPILFASVKTKQRLIKALEAGHLVFENKTKKVPTSKLNKILLPIIESHPPPAVKGKYIKIKYITQLPTDTPQFAFFCNLPQYVKEPYRRFIENKIREHFDFSGVSISIYFRKKD